MGRAEIFTLLRESKYYELIPCEIETLISYLSVKIENGSVAYICGVKEYQQDLFDKIPWVLGQLSHIPNPTEEKALSLLKSFLVQYEEYIKKMQEISDYGIEKWIYENISLVDLKYDPIDTREACIEPFISEKPQTLKEMNRLACFDRGYYLEKSFWHELYDEQFDLYFLRETVGFDKVQFNVDIVSFDINKFIQAKNALKEQTYAHLPRIIVECVDSDDEGDIPISLPVKNHKFKKIEVTLSHNITFLFQRNNSNLEENGIKKKDIYLLKTTVAPIKKKAYLGNLNNYNYDEMSTVIEESICELESLTGIVINHDSIRLNDVEINLTFYQNCKFDELMRSVSYYQNYIRKGYQTSEFKTADAGIVNFCADMGDCVCEKEFSEKKRRIVQKYSKMVTTGFTTSANTVQMKLYDKKTETINYAASQYYDLLFEDEGTIVRLEFRIRNTKQLKKYFGTDDKPVYFFELSQQEIEGTFKYLVGIFFKKTYEDGYYPEAIRTLTNIISTLDTTKKGGKWKQELIREILSQEIWQKSTPALLSEQDIRSVIKNNKTFARRPREYSNILIELLRESNIFPKGQSNAYDMLYNYLNKTYNFKTLSEHRRVAYAVSNISRTEKLTDKTEEARVREIMHKQYNDLMNKDIDDFYNQSNI